jgi:CubicO group peptidase (beta-lactamase class C family)
MNKLLILILFPLALQAQPDPAALNAIFAKAYPSDQPGASVLVVHKGQPLLHAGYGLADVAAKTPMTPDASHKIGSITKMFTAIAVLNLVAERKIDLDKSVEDYFPGLLPYGSSIRIEQLLTHVSGIPSYTNQPDFVTNMGKPDWTAMSVVALCFFL